MTHGILLALTRVDGTLSQPELGGKAEQPKNLTQPWLVVFATMDLLLGP
ncbi:MAG TPA: hypothetical protein VKT49_13550 [Bryobacteraceae bacterium]|nr:hypothetical protein [Bryobacteraceae bacterium]